MNAADELQAAAAQDRPVRPVIEHALIDYGYSPETARVLLDRLVSEEGGQ